MTQSNYRMADKSQPDLRLAGLANDGWSNENEATATCFCGAVQLAFVSFLFPNAPTRLNLPTRLDVPTHIDVSTHFNVPTYLNVPLHLNLVFLIPTKLILM